jgi:hypothetical protein
MPTFMSLASYGEISPQLRNPAQVVGCEAEADRFESYLRSQTFLAFFAPPNRSWVALGPSSEPGISVSVTLTHPRLLTDAAHPFIPAGRGVARLAGLAAFEASRIDVLASSEEGTEEGDLVLRR